MTVVRERRPMTNGGAARVRGVFGGKAVGMGLLRGLGRAVGGLLLGVFGLLAGLLTGLGALLRRLF
jgi:hypothetical protein